MDINMNNVTFVKGTDNWIYLITDGSTELEEDNGIKVFYDDGSLINPTMDMATYYKNYMKDIAGKNNLAALDYLAGSVDF